MDQKYYSTTEAAKILGVSRITIFNRIKSGKLKAEKFGRNYLIPKNQLPTLPSEVSNDAELSSKEKALIEKGLKKTILDFGETLKLLGKE